MLLLVDNCNGQTSGVFFCPEVTFHQVLLKLQVPEIGTLTSFRINAKCAPCSAHIDLESSQSPLSAKHDGFCYYPYESSFFHLSANEQKTQNAKVLL